MKGIVAGALIAIPLIGCGGTGTSVKIGAAPDFAPTDPAGIVLLIEPPGQAHSVIALVEGSATTDNYLTQKGTEDAAVQALKDEAARIGAHAVVLTGKGTAPYGSVGIATTTGSAVTAGGYTSGYATTTSTGLGWEKITYSGTAIRYNE